MATPRPYKRNGLELRTKMQTLLQFIRFVAISSCLPLCLAEDLTAQAQVISMVQAYAHTLDSMKNTLVSLTTRINALEAAHVGTTASLQSRCEQAAIRTILNHFKESGSTSEAAKGPYTADDDGNIGSKGSAHDHFRLRSNGQVDRVVGLERQLGGAVGSGGSRTRIDSSSVSSGIVNATELHVESLIWRGRPWSPNEPTLMPSPLPSLGPSSAPTQGPTPTPPKSDVVTAAMAVSSYDAGVGVTICQSVCTTGSRGPTAATLYNGFYLGSNVWPNWSSNTFVMHSNTLQFPAYVGVDLTSVYPDGFALNQIKWVVHVRCFGKFDVQGSNTVGTWTDGDDDFDGSTPQVLEGEWVTIASGLDAGGYNVGSDGDVWTSTFENNVKFTKYRVKIVGVGTGWASYGWQWNRI